MNRDDWSAVPARDPGTVPDAHVAHGDRTGQEARHGSATSAALAAGRVHGRPAPQYGEYAPAGWVNPVLADQARAAQEHAAATPPAARPAQVRTGRPAPTRPGGRSAAPVKRLGASQGDLFLTLMLLGLGLWSVIGYFRTGEVATAVRRAIEQQYTALSDPSALSTAANVNLVGALTILVFTVWWSVTRLRAGKRSVWVPLLGGVVATVFSTVVFMVVLSHDPAFAAWWAQRNG
ncbi:DUF6264 family protein [Curtobacterium sp. MCBA15_001]|uniref:DUF6264 family protein n=1 Tax=Curtobacterium sp. MCBA15_001 TaxID=1898731 RepID=UPI0008DD814A|nr:DUF6264 family protein [Curtobacterium sp. MCBA15_001]OIH98197.1 hypothetical protein BIU90_12560 [Curtobacterium sp. MCBA15_001]